MHFNWNRPKKHKNFDWSAHLPYMLIAAALFIAGMIIDRV